MTDTLILSLVTDKKSEKGANIRNRYNQVPHMTQDTTWETKQTQTSQTRAKRSALFHKAAMNRSESMTHKTEITQMIHERSTTLEWSEKYFTGGFKPSSRRQPHS